MKDNAMPMTDEQITKQACDTLIHLAAKTMVDEVGAPMPMVLDRVLTWSAAQACMIDGSANTAEMFRDMADRIERGLFASITGETKFVGGQR